MRIVHVDFRDHAPGWLAPFSPITAAPEAELLAHAAEDYALWEPALLRTQGTDQLIVVPEPLLDGRHVLRNAIDCDLVMALRTEPLADGVLSARLRVLSGASAPYQGYDESRGIEARTGLFFRQRHLRCYYAFSFLGLDRVALFRREHEEFEILGECRLTVDTTQYYDLRVRLSGVDIRCSVNGLEVIRVQDSTLSAGLCGLRTNTLMHVAELSLSADAKAQAANRKVQATVAAREEALQASNPAPQLVTETPSPFSWPWSHTFIRLDRGPAWHVLFQAVGNADEGTLAIVDLAGREVWRRRLDGRLGTVRTVSCADADGDGREEVLAVTDTHMCLLRGDSGETVCEKALPAHGVTVPMPWRPQQRPFALGWPVYWVHFDGLDEPPVPVLLGPYSDVCCLDRELNCRWIFHGGSGHSFHAADIDGDGREEFGVNHVVLDRAGRVVWELPDREYLATDLHADYVALANFAGDPDGGFQWAATMGDGGFRLVDMSDGRTLAEHRVGHAQGLAVGNFFPERPGVEFLAGNRWGNYGIWSVFGCDGTPIASCQPDFVTQGGIPTNWSGTGQELLTVAGGARAQVTKSCRGGHDIFQPIPLPLRSAYGLYTADGLCAVRLPPEREWCELHLPLDIRGDGRDNLVFSDDRAVYVYAPSGEPPPDCYRPRRPTDRRGGARVSLRP